MKKELKDRIAAYSAVAAAGIGVSHGQVVYTDIPDTTISTTGGFYDLDLNQDGEPDFRITQYVDTGVNANTNAVLISPFDTIWNWAAGEMQNTFNYPFRLQPGTILDHSENFSGIGGPHATGYMAFEIGGVSYPNSNWVGPIMDGFLGVHLVFDNSQHFGWVRLDVSDSSKSFTVKDFAVELTGDSAIVVGGTLIGLHEEDVQNIKIYQSGEFLNITMIDANKSGHFSLIDLSGVAVKEGDYNGDTRINVSDLASGLYIVSLNVEGTVYSEKIIIQN